MIPRDQAEKEVNEWLDLKKVSAKKREASKDAIDTLIEAVEEGNLTLNDDKTFTQKLKFPTDGELSIKDLSYKSRLKVSTLHAALKGSKASDADERILAYVAALTTKPKAVITALDTEDYNICQSIAIFFL